jgi:hypothetical protein
MAEEKKKVVKKAEPKKTVAKKPAAKKPVAKKAETKKVEAKKPATKKAVVAKKPAAKKVETKKVEAKKPVAKKVEEKKVEAKKPVAKKAEAKKVATKKPAKKAEVKEVKKEEPKKVEAKVEKVEKATKTTKKDNKLLYIIGAGVLALVAIVVIVIVCISHAVVNKVKVEANDFRSRVENNGYSTVNYTPYISLIAATATEDSGVDQINTIYYAEKPNTRIVLEYLLFNDEESASKYLTKYEADVKKVTTDGETVEEKGNYKKIVFDSYQDGYFNGYMEMIRVENMIIGATTSVESEKEEIKTVMSKLGY